MHQSEIAYHDSLKMCRYLINWFSRCMHVKSIHLTKCQRKCQWPNNNKMPSNIRWFSKSFSWQFCFVKMCHVWESDKMKKKRKWDEICFSHLPQWNYPTAAHLSSNPLVCTEIHWRWSYDFVCTKRWLPSYLSHKIISSMRWYINAFSIPLLAHFLCNCTYNFCVTELT